MCWKNGMCYRMMKNTVTMCSGTVVTNKNPELFKPWSGTCVDFPIA